MAENSWWSMWCENCGAHKAVQAEDASQAKEAAEEEGWHHTPVMGLPVCGSCWDKHPVYREKL